MKMVSSRLPTCLLTLILLQLPKLDSAHFDVVGPEEPILAMVGEDVELPCHLSPNMSARNMELRWFRKKVSEAVLVHRDGQLQDKDQVAEYRGRATLVRDNLSQGRMAVRIHGIKAKDAGEYRCFFREKEDFEEAVVQLQVAALGSDPHVHMEVQENGEIRLKCTSEGWYPEPQVQWRTAGGQKFPSMTESRTPDEEGLFTVAASVTIRNASPVNVSCSIQNPLLGQEKEVEISIPAPLFPRLTSWMVVTIVVVTVLGLLSIASIFFTWRLYKERCRERKEKFSSKENLLEDLKWKKASLHAVDVTLDPDTAHPHLFLYEDSKSVRLEDSRQKALEKPERFDSWPCVLGRETFTSGKHYWEVEVGDRTDWAIGVCKENVMKKGFDPMTPENGFWAVELYGNGYWALTSVRTPLPLPGPPRRVGIFLDYESGDVSFYNMTDGSLIYSFPKTSFSGPLRPFFCLWTCGNRPLSICPVTDGPDGVTVLADTKDMSKEIPLSPLGDDPATGDADTPHSKLIPTQPGQAAS
ncbi:butyrophilin subfamily 1 member A1 [Sorex araneus]|uniref:butyrophilin subfamily 1 member A1 n=1 Tax=Sorex araneus TaxID=42254 RepID=UPI002433ADE1|nr:butyrophilin subfamily 1 member A1 [Sorex araneus]